MTPFDPILHFFAWELTAIRLRAKFEISSFNRSRDIRGGQNSNIASRDPHMTPFDPILHFFALEVTTVRLRAKYEVSSFNRSRDIGGHKIPKLCHVTPTWPLLTQFWMFFVRTHRRPSPRQIWSF